MWWMIDVGFSHALDEKNATQAQKKCLHLDCQAPNIIYQSLSDKIFGEIMYMKTVHDIWLYLNLIYGRVSDDDDDDDEPKEEAHECVKHDHNLVIVEDCSISWSSDDDDDRSTTSSLYTPQMALSNHSMVYKSLPRHSNVLPSFVFSYF